MNSICFVNDADRDAFRELVARQTKDVSGVQNLESALRMVDIDSHGDTKCDGKINGTEWQLFMKGVTDYTGGRKTRRFTFNELEATMNSVIAHQTEVWRAGAQAAVCGDEKCGCS
ncbi:MAG: hypothetical protein AAFQ82_04840 [Myxococcota bacterium]